jgi:hypothetical protein
VFPPKRGNPAGAASRNPPLCSPHLPVYNLLSSEIESHPSTQAFLPKTHQPKAHRMEWIVSIALLDNDSLPAADATSSVTIE